MRASSPVNIDVQHFRHKPDLGALPIVTYFQTNNISTPRDLLTLIIRTDAKFATRSLRHSFEISSVECAQGVNSPISPEHFAALAESAYKNWGEDIVSTLAETLDYQGQYQLTQTAGRRTNVHFHSADSLAGAVIRKACAISKKLYPHASDIMFISLDDMIHEDVFRANVSQGQFGEIGFSRQFSRAGEELGFVGRPGRPSIEFQVREVRNKLAALRGNNSERIPIILLEDNVRRAKTLLWIFNEMEKGGIFEHGELGAVATCFSVAPPQEQAQMCVEGRQVPLIIGIDYVDSLVDVVTPRDHLFDGFVVQHRGGLGRLPSFMLSPEQIVKNFKISPEQVNTFVKKVVQSNINFCQELETSTGITPLLNWFTPGQTMAEVLDMPVETPMREVLKRIPSYAPQIRLIPK